MGTTPRRRKHDGGHGKNAGDSHQPGKKISRKELMGKNLKFADGNTMLL
jgi:hypothetical protein